MKDLMKMGYSFVAEESGKQIALYKGNLYLGRTDIALKKIRGNIIGPQHRAEKLEALCELAGHGFRIMSCLEEDGREYYIPPSHLNW